MSKISRMSYKTLGQMINSAVGAGVLDRSSGRAHLPDPLLFRMQDLAERYEQQRRNYDKLVAQAQIIRKKRDEISPMIAQMVRHIHKSFNRFHKLGKISKEEMSAFQIPKKASPDATNRLKVWAAHGQTLVRVFRKSQEEGHTLPPPYVLTEATVDILAHHAAEGADVQNTLERQELKNDEEHTRLVELRKQVVESLELAHRHLNLSLFGKTDSEYKRTMASYGMLLPEGKGKKHLLTAGMIPYDTPMESDSQMKESQEATQEQAEKVEQVETSTAATAEPPAEPETKDDLESAQEPSPILRGKKKARGQKKIRGKRRKMSLW